MSKRFFSTLASQAQSVSQRSRGPIHSGLYVPGNQQRMLSKCQTLKASLIVPDLEDSVPFHEKPAARDLIRQNLHQIREASGSRTTITVRANSLCSGLFHDDITEILKPFQSSSQPMVHDLIDGFCCTKVDSVEIAKEICSFLAEQEKQLKLPEQYLKVIPQIESTAALADCKEILGVGQGRFIAAAFGADDFTADYQIKRMPDDKNLEFSKQYFALCCHARGVTSIDTPYVDYKNTEGLRLELEYLKSIGIKAKFAIHPGQVAVINQAFQLTQDQVSYYSRLVEEFEKAQEQEGKAAINFEGKMVDIAAFRRAKAMLETHRLNNQD